MPHYLRAKIEGGTFLFTVTLADRRGNLLAQEIDLLRSAYRLLPEHLHTIWSLPEGDADYPKRWNLIKGGFSRLLPASAFRSPSKIAKREKGIWQRRCWEHAIRDEADLARHVDYIHFNPVKHGLVSRVRDWPHSSFHRFVERGDLPLDWGGDVRILSSDAFG